MKKHFLSKLLTILLIASMILTMLPVSAMAYYGGNWNSLWESIWGGSDDETADEGSDEVDTYATSDNYRIVHLDCGRKYFSVNNIKKLIDTMHQYGYNQLQLAFGNGGCRFLLDEMPLSFNDGQITMDSDTVKNNIKAGNIEFNGDERYLTQTEMTNIIEYARNRQIEIVPMLNMPGHADAIVYNTSYASGGKLNVDDEAARNYGTALLKKYVDYFKDQGCKYFHFGSDESGYEGTNMTKFLTACAKVITDANMIPRAFNDATNVATMPTSVQITYWHKETDSKTASALASNYQMINTHGRWYYVIKEAQNSEINTKYWQGTVNRAETSVELPVMKAEKMDRKWVELNEYFDGNPGYGSTIPGSRGTMFCIWCDASQDAYLTDSDVISDNENYGALYQIKKLAEHYWPDDVTVPGSTVPTVSLQDGSPLPDSVAIGDELSLKASQSVVWTTTNSDVIDLSVPAQTRASKSIEGTEVTAVAKGAGRAEIQVSDAASGKTNSYPITVAQDATSQEVRLQIGEKRTFEVASSVKAGSYINGNEAYLATAVVTEGTTAQEATLQPVTSIESGKSYLICNQRKEKLLTNKKTSWQVWFTSYKCLLLDGTATPNSSAKWKLTGSGTTYTAQFESNNGGYLSISNNTASMSSQSKSLTFEYNYNDGYWNISSNNYYLNNLGDTTAAGGWKDNAAPTDAGSRWTIYEVVAGAPTSNTLTIAAVGEGDTTVTIGDVTYNIYVTAPSKTENKVLSKGGTLTLPAGAADVSVTSGGDVVTYQDSSILAQTEGNATVTFTTKNNGGYVTARYTYNISVTTANLDDAQPLPVQLWITNTWVSAEKDPTSLQTVNVPAKEAYNENGVALSTFVPSPAYKKDGGNVRVIYWKGVALHGIDPSVTAGDYSTDSRGDDFTTIRYWNNEWQYLKSGSWTEIKNDDTVVAYYLQTNDASSEIQTATQHYGNPPTDYPGSNSGNGYWLTAYAVVYPDHTLSRTEEEMYRTGMVRGFWGATEDSLGIVYAENNSTYRVSKMTVTRGKSKLGTSGDDWYTKNKTTAYGTDWGVDWEKKPNSAGVEWYDETTYWQYGDSDVPMINNESVKASTSRNALLVLIYLEVVETDNTLSVVYWDDNTNTQITTDPMPMPIVVKPGVTFLNGIKNSGTITSGPITLSDNAYIENSTGSKQGFNKELSTVPGVGGGYLSGMYKYVGADVSTDGLTLTLHFNLNEAAKKQTFVVDFGLPLVIRATDFDLANTDQIESVSLESNSNTMTHDGVYGTATIAADYQTVTYRLNKPLGSSRVTIPLYVKYKGEATPQLFQANVLPATNILYEENFLTAADTSGWTKAGSALTTAQETQKVGVTDRYEVFGYDKAYVKNGAQNVTGRLGVWQASGLQYSKSTGVMTTEFYGNGFDLIGSCGKNTGRILLGIFKGNEKRPVATRIIDTKFDDASVAEMLYQVPLAHVMLKEAAQYRVEIYASGVKEQTNNARANSRSVSAAAYSYDDYADGFASILDSYGVRMSDVEYIRFADIADSASAAATMSLRPVALADEGGAGSCSVEIDSFRVYRSGSDATYPANEQDVTYVNVLDRFTNGGFTAFVENGNGDGKWAKREDYESNGGPQNEIYLRKSDGTATGDAVAFNVGANQTVQISARAVETGKTAKMVVNGGTPVETEISSNTEMYYEVKADNNGIITIKNTGEAMLALGNLKVKSTQTVAELSDEQIPMAIALLSMAPAPEEPEQPAAFTPEHFDAKVSATGLGRSKIVRLTVTTSSDVAKLTVNGKELRPVNGWLVKMGWSSSYTYILSEKMPRNDSRPFEIVCYNADGVASAAHVVTGQ